MQKIKAAPQSADIYPTALTIAGSDSGGGAGIEVDLRTFNAFGVYGCAAITALTSQNPLRVTRIDAITPAGVTAQIDAVMETFPIRSVKSGMLFNADIVAAVAKAVEKHHFELICDPVMVSTSGVRLLEADAVATMIDRLIPAASWITPNLPEAELLLGRKLKGPDEYLEAARECSEKWDVDVLLKTGHDLSGDTASDVVCRKGRLYTLSAPKLDIEPHAAHGTGCTLSAALAANFALGFDWKTVLKEAKTFVYGSLAETIQLGDKIWAMYPPTEDYIDQVRLETVEAR